jgi:hypothetical protein
MSAAGAIAASIGASAGSIGTMVVVEECTTM